MYQVEAWASWRRASRGAWRRPLARAVAPNVLALGVTSLLTDVSSEMVNTVLPAYLVLHLGLSPFSYGLLDGIAQGVAALTHLVTGVTADRFRRCKEIAAAGYALSALSRLGLFAAGAAWTPIAAMVAVDRFGKGVRTVPRDLLISLSTPPAGLATAFGVHRALDSAGAMAGPLVALAILAAVPAGFDVVFMSSFCIALCGVAALALFVTNVPKGADEAARAPVSLTRLPIHAALSTPRVARLLGAVLLLGVATVNDAFIYLILQRQVGFNAGVLPLLYMGTAGSYLLLSMPAGWAADRFGRGPVFLGGYALLGCVYGVALASAGGTWTSVVVALLCLGGYYAATDGVLMALAGALCPPSVRGSGMALLTTAVGVGRLLAAVAFGAVWTTYSTAIALGIFLAALLAALGCAAALLGRLPDAGRGEAA